MLAGFPSRSTRCFGNVVGQFRFKIAQQLGLKFAHLTRERRAGFVERARSVGVRLRDRFVDPIADFSSGGELLLGDGFEFGQLGDGFVNLRRDRLQPFAFLKNRGPWRQGTPCPPGSTDR